MAQDSAWNAFYWKKILQLRIQSKKCLHHAHFQRQNRLRDQNWC